MNPELEAALRFIDPVAAQMTFGAWLAQDDEGGPQVFYASALAVLACGHKRPINSHPTMMNCLTCRCPMAVLDIERIELTDFPHPAILDTPAADPAPGYPD